VDFVAVVDHVLALLRQRGRVTYRTLKRQFQVDDEVLEDLKEDLIVGQQLAVDEEGKVLVWSGETGMAAPAAVAPAGIVKLLGMILSPDNSRHFPEAIATNPTLRQPAPYL
jgi:hypothetical protein